MESAAANLLRLLGRGSFANYVAPLRVRPGRLRKSLKRELFSWFRPEPKMATTKYSHADQYRAIPTPTLIKLHPLPLLTIVDAHERRRPGLEKVIGCLVGRRITGDVVEVTDCFLVPHEEGESPSSSFTIDTKTLESIIQQHKIINPGEKLLGWYSSSAKHLDKAASVHRLWLKQVAQPIFLTLDCAAHLDIKTYVGIPTTGSLDAVFGSGAGVAAAFEFVSIPFDVICFPTERAALDLVQMTRKKPERQHLVPSDITTVQEVIDSMDELLTRCIKFVKDAKKSSTGSSSVTLDPEVGRALSTLVHSIPRMTAEDYERIVNGERKDFLMTTFVAGIIEAQVALQEKVNMIMY